MKIVAAGGGSGGHVTPVLAVINELKKHDDSLSVCFVTDRKFYDKANEIMKKAQVPVNVKRISAGKFRRYNRIAWWKQLLDIPTVLKNIRDLFLMGFGFLQSLYLIIRIRPDVVFTKGGYVCVPLGLAAGLFKIPLVIHDSDAHPGLASRILAKRATSIATGSPVENYNYPKGRTHYVGIPVSSLFRPVTSQEQQKLKAVCGLHDTKKPLVVVTGGGLGARNINRAMVTIAPKILEKAAVIHITGDAGYKETLERAPEHVDYIVKSFIGASGLAPIFGAADIVISRAGATTIQELAAMGKPSIFIPNPLLTGGHQLKNAEVYAKSGAAIVFDEDRLVVNPLSLLKVVEGLLGDNEKRQELGRHLYKFAKPDAAVDTAALIVEAVATRKHQEAVR